MDQNTSIEKKSQEITATIGTNTQKMKLGQNDIKLAIGSDGNGILDSDQIPTKLDKWEKELSKKRGPNE